ncbi:uncharacterized protein TRIADDRAFT_54176 [Trichoplax adhaerens]|uniref:COMM domain-containing protein n=1 Tax=Trichoplax adhaerens TaxID=10228 RepID=B3RRB6_TRIAD|nr:hypothetical protein TRIADDRAFT_54176 [Trichoplax adhaerens]EDV26314.1 hypothetical protein TRIADDRAFT_54176 [Trichoplax adhaerens]|eukprot:XP_002110310.1 hypothetical protein TRIADDRAFT_54176 [Trichoplax adhaerens]
MAASAMFQATANIKGAVSLINQLDTERFPLLLVRILQKLHVKEGRIFTEEEENKLQTSLGIEEKKDLQLILDILSFIFEQAVYHVAKPAVLKQQLLNIDLDEVKVDAFIEAWSTNAKNVIDRVRQRNFINNQLEDINWQLNLQLAQSEKTKMKAPNAILELGIRSEDKNTKEKVHVEFSHAELYDFYDKLEIIQSQLDSLNK